MTDNKLDVVIELLKDIKTQLEPETFNWKLKSKDLFELHIFDKLKYHQKKNFIKMVSDIAEKHNVLVSEMENWPTEPLRHLFYSSCKWIGVKEGKEKAHLSKLIFNIESNKPKNNNNQENTEKEENLSLFGETKNDPKLF